ncbi:MAG: RNA methyltransferase, partial [Actinomycetota bacterium]
MPDIITSTANARVKAVRELHRHKARRARRETIIEGPTVFGEFIDAGVIPSVTLCTPDDILTIERCTGIGTEPIVVTEAVLASASDTRSPRSPVAVVPVRPPQGLRAHDTVILVDISDPGNLGTMIRSAAALGWDVAVSGNTAELWSPKTIRSSAGAHLHTRLIQLADPAEDAAEAGLTTIATVVAGGARPQRHDAPVALVVGSEAHGLPAHIVETCDARITIAMPGGVESLNAAVAASIAMYAMTALDGSSFPDT